MSLDFWNFENNLVGSVSCTKVWNSSTWFSSFSFRRCSCNRHTHIRWMQSPVFAFSKTFFTRSLKAFILEIPYIYFTTRVTNFTRSLKAFTLSPNCSITGPMMVLPHQGGRRSLKYLSQVHMANLGTKNSCLSLVTNQSEDIAKGKPNSGY